MKNVSGKSDDEMFEKSMLTGGDIFSLTVERDITNIDEFLVFCYQRYKQLTYKERFAWIDNIKYVKDKSLAERLNQKLLEEIKEENFDKVWMAVPEVVTDGQIPKKYRRISPALREMGKNFRESRPVSFYAELCSMSEAGFRRLFSEYTGASPIEYRNNIRLTEAKKLIETGEYLVEEAACAVGYTNISFFCRNYKRLFGRTPLENLK
jgi:AraC-like DNA-binding protein